MLPDCYVFLIDHSYDEFVRNTPFDLCFIGTLNVLIMNLQFIWIRGVQIQSSLAVIQEGFPSYQTQNVFSTW